MNRPAGIAPDTDARLIGHPVTLYPVDSEFGFGVIDTQGTAVSP